MNEPVSNNDYVILGKINAHHGIKGWLKIYSYTDPKQNILTYKKVLLIKGFIADNLTDNSTLNISENIWKQVELDNGRIQGKGIVAHFKTYDSRESSEELIACSIVIARTELKLLPANEYYWVDLIDLAVINKEGIHLGKVVKIMPTAANDVLIIQNNQADDTVPGLQKEYLVPYIMGQYVLSVDLEQGSIQVDWDIDF